MNRAIDICLLTISLVLAFTDRPFASIVFFALGLFRLFHAAEGGKNSEAFKFHLVIGLILAALPFTGVFVAGYIDQQTVEIYQKGSAK